MRVRLARSMCAKAAAQHAPGPTGLQPELPRLLGPRRETFNSGPSFNSLRRCTTPTTPRRLVFPGKEASTLCLALHVNHGHRCPARSLGLPRRF
ncbi:unnamed protein product [Lampetra planeri]